MLRLLYFSDGAYKQTAVCRSPVIPTQFSRGTICTAIKTHKKRITLKNWTVNMNAVVTSVASFTSFDIEITNCCVF